MIRRLCLGLLLFCLIAAGATPPQQEDFLTPTRVGELQEVRVWWNWHGNIFSLTYDHISWETLLMVFDNGDIASLTGFFTTVIPVNATYFAYMCSHYGKEVGEIDLLIHNHLLPLGFSLGDMRFYEGLKRYGFKGDYLLYSPGQRIRKYLGDHKTMDLKRPWKKAEKKKQ
jgi:hypothetical protein